MTAEAAVPASLAALILLAFTTSITPGPNNLMLLASGARFGLRRTLPHLLGIAAGMMLLLALVGAGVGALVFAAPGAALGLKVFGVGYMLWLTARLLRAPAPTTAGEQQGRPLAPWQALLFQFANPKAWMMALTASAAAGASLVQPERIGTVMLVFLFVGTPCCGLWAVLGSQLARALRGPRSRALFNGSVAALLLVAAGLMAMG